MSAPTDEDLEALFDRVASEAAAGQTAVGSNPAPTAPAEDDLEVLFDQVAQQAADANAAAEATKEEDLEALFDAVAAQAAVGGAADGAAHQVAGDAPALAAMPADAASAEVAAAIEPPPPQEVFLRIGSLTRNLHDALRELGYDKAVESAVNSLPDARDRLSYIADLTGKAAERALSAVEKGQQYQSELTTQAERLAGQWDQAFDGALTPEAFKQIAVDTRTFLKGLPQQTGATSSQLTEIMMAQDFHDLTGQVIQRIVKVAQNLEAQLVKLLLETTPPEKRPAAESEWLTGPAMHAAQRDDVVADQAQVDELLESLGF